MKRTNGVFPGRSPRSQGKIEVKCQHFAPPRGAFTRSTALKSTPNKGWVELLKIFFKEVILFPVVLISNP